VKTSKLIFDIQEIPEGKSSKTVSLTGEEYDLESEVTLKSAEVQISFYKTDHFIRTSFDVHAETGLICDRTLKPFSHSSDGSYDILFDPNPVEEHDMEKGTVKQIQSDGLTISIEKEVRDTILLSLPSRKVHPDLLDSEGNPVEYETKSFGKIEADDDYTDPRWEELKKLKQ
jgi:uncharacterized metal-binding protein YceD (DUF177 family)